MQWTARRAAGAVGGSWDHKVGDKRFILMNDPWFAEYMFAMAASRDEPTVLPAWDPTGSLAA